jgi:ribosomal protein S18 acetylase RimI-like enzyme
MEWRVRTATVDDAAGVAEVHVASWRAAYEGLVPQRHLDRLETARSAQTWPTVMAMVDVALVAETDHGIVGFATAGASRDDGAEADVAEVSAIYVERAWWRRGIGTALIGGCAIALAERGYRQATLWVLESNGAARAFYERLGWAVDGARERYPLGEETRPVVRYRRNLP